MPRNPFKETSGSVKTPRADPENFIRTAADVPAAVEKVLVGRGTAQAVVSQRKPQPRPPRPTKKRKDVPLGDGHCRAYSPRGTKCKLCGKVHP